MEHSVKVKRNKHMEIEIFCLSLRESDKMLKDCVLRYLQIALEDTLISGETIIRSLRSIPGRAQLQNVITLKLI